MSHNLTLPVSPETRAEIQRIQEEQYRKAVKEALEAKAAKEAEELAAEEAAKPKPAEPRQMLPGTRRFHSLSPEVRRPLECYMSSLKRREGMTRDKLSSLLDLHPDDLDALAASAGSI